MLTNDVDFVIISSSFKGLQVLFQYFWLQLPLKFV